MTTCYFTMSGGKTGVPSCGQNKPSHSSLCSYFINSTPYNNMFHYGTCESAGYCNKCSSETCPPSSGYDYFDKKVPCGSSSVPSPIVNHITNTNKIHINWKDAASYTEY